MPDLMGSPAEEVATESTENPALSVARGQSISGNEHPMAARLLERYLFLEGERGRRRDRDFVAPRRKSIYTWK